MTDRLLDKYTSRVGRGGGSSAKPSPASSQTEEIEDHGCFGWLRGIRDRAVMLELRKKDGRVLAIPYGWIERIEYDPDRGITLICGGKAISIQGHGLGNDSPSASSLLSGLIRHRVPWVRESPESLATTQSSLMCTVDSIGWDEQVRP